MRLLVPTDFSASSEEVIRQIESRPWPDGTEARLLNVVDVLAGGSTWVDVGPYLERQQQDAESLIGTFAARLSAHGLHTSTDVVCGHPSASVPECADDWKADLVMLGSHGQTALVRFLFGSVAAGTLRRAPCSVEVVRPAKESKKDGGLRILLAIDGSPCSKIVPVSIACLLWPAGSEVKVISVLEPALAPVDPYYKALEAIEQMRQKTAEETKEWLLQAAIIIQAQGLKVTTDLLEGYPKAVIVDNAKQWDADLIVVGSHGRRGLARLFLGSVAEAVALHAPCSVRVVRRP